MSDVAEEAYVLNAVGDMLYHIEHEGQQPEFWILPYHSTYEILYAVWLTAEKTWHIHQLTRVWSSWQFQDAQLVVYFHSFVNSECIWGLS